MAGTIPSRKRVGGNGAPGLLSLSASGGKTRGEPAPGGSGRPSGRAPAGAAAKAPGEPRPGGGSAHKTGAAEGALAPAERGRGSAGEPQGEPPVPRCTRNGGRARGRNSLPAPAAATAPCPGPPLIPSCATGAWCHNGLGVVLERGSLCGGKPAAAGAARGCGIREERPGRGQRGARRRRGTEEEQKEEEDERRPGCSYCSAPAPAGTRGAAEPRSSPPAT